MESATAHFPFLGRFRPLTYVLVLLAITGLAYAEDSPGLFLIASFGTLISWWIVERPNGKPLPRFMINLGVLTASAGLFFELVISSRDDPARAHPNLLISLGHFMLAILLCKLFERKSSRDYAQILTLSLLIMVAGAILATASFFFAFVLAIYLAVGFYAILLFHLRSETQRALVSYPEAGPFHLEAAGELKRDIRRITKWSAALLLVISMAVFLVFPRWREAPEFFTSWMGASAATGFSETVHMHDEIHVTPSETVVMEVKIEQNGVNLGSQGWQPYFRGAVNDNYDSRVRQWMRSPSDVKSSDDTTYILQHGSIAEFAGPDNYQTLGVTQTYTLETAHEGALFALMPPISLSSDQLDVVEFSSRDMTLRLPSPLARMQLPLTYTVVSRETWTPDLISRYRDPFAKEPYWSVPRDDLGRWGIMPSQITPLAEKLVKDQLPANADSVAKIAAKFQEYLRANYPYSLDFKNTDPKHLDPTADFLLNHHKTGGYCEQFASAMVMMCRAVGIRARMALGYHGGEFNSIGGFYVVKGKDAHTWVEVYLPQRGWTIYDPTPAAAETSTAASITQWFRQLAQVLQKVWTSTVVAFDNTSRMVIFSAVGSFFSSAAGWIKDLCVHALEGFWDVFAPTSPRWLQAAVMAVLAAMGALLGWIGRKWRRQRTSELPRILRTVDPRMHRQLAHDLIFFDDALRLLARTGLRKLPEQTPREYVDSLSVPLGIAVTDARWLIVTFYAIRFGALRMTDELRQEISAALRRMRISLQHHPADRVTSIR